MGDVAISNARQPDNLLQPQQAHGQGFPAWFLVVRLGVEIAIFAGQISWLLLPLMVIYALLLSPLVGLTFGALLVSKRILGQLSSILGLCLGLVTAMVADLKTLADRCASNQAIPSLPVLLVFYLTQV